MSHILLTDSTNGCIISPQLVLGVKKHMPYLSRTDLEGIAERIFAAYKRLPELEGREVYSVDPELLARRALGLRVEYHTLSPDGSVLGLTSFGRASVRVWDGGGGYVELDGKTVLVEKSLRDDAALRGRYGFTLAHEAGHQALAMLYPREYHMEPQKPRFYRPGLRGRGDWEEWQASVLASAILMPRELVERGMFLMSLGDRLRLLNRLYAPREYERFCDLAALLRVSKSALAIRMGRLGLLEHNFLRRPQAFADVDADDDRLRLEAS